MVKSTHLRNIHQRSFTDSINLVIRLFSPPKQPRNLVLAYKTILGFWDCFRNGKYMAELMKTDLDV